jgi:GT2 family glycosyltransferase
MAGSVSVIPVSVIIVSRHRTLALTRCITALRQQDYPDIEVIVVADPAAIGALQGQDDVKQITFDRANISQARNLGLSMAAGDVVMFIDDDAVPEPNWARQLAAPFADMTVVAATGFIRGRNGISYQWRASTIDHLGNDHPLDVPPSVSLHSATAQRAVKTQGTNCAFRSTALRSIGGFDPAFAFFLDEGDVNLRMAHLGLTAVVPDAQVHHGYLASARRRADRAPISLFEIGASTAAFLRKHAPGADMAGAWAKTQAEQSARLARFAQRGYLKRGDVAGLMLGLEQGWQSGQSLPIGAQPLADLTTAYLPLQGPGPRQNIYLCGYIWAAKDLHRQARQAMDQGKNVTVFCFSPGFRRHKMQFLPEGYWWQAGGIWGRADRATSVPFAASFRGRVALEWARLARFRPKHT